MSTHNRPNQESALAPTHTHLLCWKSCFAGLLITLMAMLMLTSLGGIIGGSTAEGMVGRGEGGTTLLSSAGLYLGLSMVISLFCGTYFALRLTRFVTAKIGAAHGFVIASLFFMLTLSGAGSLLGSVASGVGSMAKGLGHAAKGAGKGVTDIASNPAVQDAVDKVIGTTPLKANAAEVGQGLVTRLATGDVDSAKAYLIRQTGQTPQEVDAKVEQLKMDLEAAAKRAGEQTARAVTDTSLTLLVIFFVGLLGAVVGGRIGAHSNADRPLAVISNQRGSVVPYAIGWLLGVPVSLLVLIAMLRAIF